MAKKKKKTDLDRILDGTYQSPLLRSSKNTTFATNNTTTSTNKQSDLDQVLSGSYTPKLLGSKPKANIVNLGGTTTSGKSNARPTSKRNDKWFQTGNAFSDGYDVGDVTRTILGTGADIGIGVGKGIFRLGEGIGDLITYGEAQVFDWAGKDEFADNLRAEAKKSLADEWLNPVEDLIASDSVIGDKGDSISEGLGYVAGMIATGGTASGLALKTGKSLNQAGKIATAITTGTTFTSSMGSSIGEAYQGGATDGQAWAYGTIGGLAEAGTELMFGGLGKAVNATGLSKGISSLDDQLAKKVSGLFKSTLSKNLAEYGIKAGAEGFEEVASGVIQALGQKITYASEKDLLKLLDDQDLLEQFITGAIVSGIAQAPSLIKANNTGESFVKTEEQIEEESKKIPYQYQVREQDSEFKKATLESSKGVMNDTTKSRELMDALVSMAEERQMPYKVTTTEKLLNSNYIDETTKQKIRDSYDPKTKKYNLNANGVYEIDNNGKREVLVNVESKKYLEQILVHETAHDFKNGDAIRYKNLQQATFEYAKETGELAKIESEVREIYQGQNEDIINEEITSRLLEDYVGNESFIKNLTSKQPKIVKDIIDQIKYLFKKFTAGSEQAKKLLDLQHKVEKAYKEAYNEQVSDTQAKINKAVRDKVGDKRVIAPEVKKEAVEVQKKAENKTKEVVKEKEDLIPTKQDLDNDTGVSKIKEKYEKANKVEGTKRSIVLNNGEKLSGTYKLVEAGSVTPSHNSQNFAKSDNFPLTDKGTTINDRDYENDKTAQQLVMEKAQNYDGRAFNDNGVIVSKDGIVVSGNDRTMAGEIAGRNNTDKAYIEYIKENAEQYGFTKEQIESMKHPRVVLELDENVEYNTKTYAKFNKDSKKTKSVSEKAKEIGKTIEDNTIVQIANVFDNYDTIDQVYNSPKASRDLLDLMLNKGLIDNNEISQVYDGSKFTGAGKDLVEATIIGSVVDEGNVRYFRNNNNLKFKVMKSAPALIQNKTLGDYSIEQEINNAMSYYKDAQESGMSVNEFGNQMGLFGDNDADLVTKKIAEILEKKGYKELRNFLDKYNEIALAPAKGQVDLFTGEIKTKEEVLNESLNINEDTELERRYSLSKDTDNKGRLLTAGQKAFFKNSKAKGQDGELVTVYHTVNHEVEQFDEFNPVGTRGYRFDDQVVNYYTDSKDMSGSYANSDYEMADTKRINNMDEFKEFLDRKSKLSTRTIELEESKDGYKIVDNTEKIAYEKAMKYYNEGFTEEERALIEEIADNNNKINEQRVKLKEQGKDYEAFLLIDKLIELDEEAPEIEKKFNDLYGVIRSNENYYVVGAYENKVRKNIDYTNGSKTIGTFKTEEELFRNARRTLDKALDIRNAYQYEGYVNITNPYVVDAEGRYWSEVRNIESEKSMRIETIPQELKTRLTELAEESGRIYEEIDLKYNEYNNTIINLDDFDKKIYGIYFQYGDINDFYDFLEGDFSKPSKVEKYLYEFYNRGLISRETWHSYYEIVNETDPESLHIKEEIKEKTKETREIVKNATIEFQDKTMPMKDFAEEAYKIRLKMHGNTPQKYFEDQIFENETFRNEIEDATGLVLMNAYGKSYDTLNRLFDVSYNEYDKDKIINAFGKSQTTNDIVKQIIAVNKNGENYDGIIIRNVIDYGGRPLGETKPNDLYITFDSNQFKAVDNENPTNDRDIRYSLSKDGGIVDNEGNKVMLEASETGTTGSLMAIHNITKRKLKGLLELGGIPVPSIAITNPSIVNHQQFGEISLLFGKETIDPADYRNEVYDRDVWSPTFPQVNYDITNEALKSITKNIDYDHRDEIINKAVLKYFYAENLKDYLNSGGLEDTLNRIKADIDMQYFYQTSVADEGLEKVMKPRQYSYDYSNETLQEFLNVYQGDKPLNELSYDETMALGKQIKEIIRPVHEETMAKVDKDYLRNFYENEFEKLDTNYNKLVRFVDSAYKLQKYGADAKVVDVEATLNKVKDVINKKEYEKWVDDNFGKVLSETKKGIRNDKEPFTNSGNRRSFNQLHEDYNLQNVVRYLTNKSTIASQDGFTEGFGSLQAKMSSRFNSIEDIKNKEGRITNEASLDKFSLTISVDAQELGFLYENKEYATQGLEQANQVLHDFAGYKNQDKSSLKRALERNGFNSKDVPEYLQNEIINDINALKEIPTDYFEAKPQRAVGFDEVQAVIVPKDINANFKQDLINRGFNVVEYDHSIGDDRQAKINEFDNLKFSLSNQDIAPIGTGTLGEDVRLKKDEDIAPIIRAKDPTKESSYVDDFEISGTPIERKPKVEKNKVRKLVDDFRTHFVNSYHEVENLAKETGNKRLVPLADMLNSVYGEISSQITFAQTNLKGEEIGKPLKALFQPAKDKGVINEFDDYLKHKLNIERWARNKPLNENITANVSKEYVKMYERKYPEFTKWAEDIYTYNRNLLDMSVEAGLINNALAKKLTNEIYPSYVPILRDVDVTPYVDDSGNIAPVRVLKHAKGGSNPILSIEESMTKHTMAVRKATRQNLLHQEMYKELSKIRENKWEHIEDENLDPTDATKYLYVDDSGKYLVTYYNGKAKMVKLGDDLYHAMSNDLHNQIKELENKYELIAKPLQKASEIRRNLLTTWSPSFIITNPIMDFQDAIFNSKHTKDMLKNYAGAYVELTKQNTKEVRQFTALYGAGNNFGEYNVDDIGKESRFGNNKFIKGIAKANEIVELAPRYAEFKASLQNGDSVEQAIYNARDLTTNFSRGGEITKALNRNGVTFLNASVQGFDKLYRNFKGENGAKGYAQLLTKVATIGLLPAIVNHLLLDDDEEYEALPDYIKENYYLFKTSEGEFLRIPKGRVLSIFGGVARRTLEYMQGEEDAFEGYLTNAYSRVGVGNPLEGNVLSPLIQAYGSENGEAWYGGDLVPTRLQDLPAEEQFDEGTDKASIFLGDLFNTSPYKLNYVLDQYSGGIGDIILPLITDEAQSDGSLLAPLADKFRVNSTSDNKYVRDFYDASGELEVTANGRKASDEDVLKSKYMKAIGGELAQLYKEKRAIQSDNSLSKSEKYEKVQSVQREINNLAKQGLDSYENINKTSNYAIVGDREYYKYYDEKEKVDKWGTPSDTDLDALNSLGATIQEKGTFYSSKAVISSIQDEYKSLIDSANDDTKQDLYASRKKEIIEEIKKANLSNSQKAFLYSKYYSSDSKLKVVTKLDIDFDKYLDYESQYFVADKDSKGNTISGSKKTKIFNYLNSMDLGFEEKLILAKLEYKTYNEYNKDIINYLNNSNISYEEEVEILKELGFEVDDQGNIYW